MQAAVHAAELPYFVLSPAHGPRDDQPYKRQQHRDGEPHRGSPITERSSLGGCESLGRRTVGAVDVEPVLLAGAGLGHGAVRIRELHRGEHRGGAEHPGHSDV